MKLELNFLHEKANHIYIIDWELNVIPRKDDYLWCMDELLERNDVPLEVYQENQLKVSDVYWCFSDSLGLYVSLDITCE